MLLMLPFFDTKVVHEHGAPLNNDVGLIDRYIGQQGAKVAALSTSLTGNCTLTACLQLSYIFLSRKQKLPTTPFCASFKNRRSCDIES